MSWLLAALFFLGLGWLVSLWLTRPRLRCPECGSREVRIIKKEPDGFSHADYGGGGAGGGWSAAQVYYQVAYRCAACGATWQRRIVESS